MHCLYVHDFRAYFYKEKIYSTNFSYNEVWKERYLALFDRVTIINRCGIAKADLADKMVISNGPNIEYEGSIPFFKGPEVFFDTRVQHTLKNQIKKCDCVIMRLPSFLGLMAIKECRKQKKPYLIEVAGCVWDSFWNHSIYGKILAPYLFIRVRKEIKNAEYVIYVTSQFLQKRYPNKGKNTNCSNVALKEFCDKDIEKRLARISNNRSKVIIGTIAAVNVRYKGQQYIIKALGKLKKDGNTNFEYRLVGGGDNTYLKKVAAKNGVSSQVIFEGSLPHDAVFEWLKSIDIYAQPSRQEGLPRSLIEAMSLGIPAIGAKTGGIPELLENEYIFDNNYHNIQQIVDILYKMDPDVCKKAAVTNYKEAQKYKKETIENRRKNFFLDFVEYAKN